MTISILFDNKTVPTCYSSLYDIATSSVLLIEPKFRNRQFTHVLKALTKKYGNLRIMLYFSSTDFTYFACIHFWIFIFPFLSIY